ncbi:hypothetical protein FRX31_015118, partial [Thalictrum thalictroides]
MSNTTCCHCLVQCPSLLLPPVSRFRALKRSRIYSWSLCNRSFRSVEFDSRSLQQKREVCCFRHEESTSGLPEGELVENKQLEELGGPELDQSSVSKKDLVTSFKEAADAVFRKSGKPWTVPWTAETILQ